MDKSNNSRAPRLDQLPNVPHIEAHSTDQFKQLPRDAESDLPAPKVRAAKGRLSLMDLRRLRQTGERAMVNADEVFHLASVSRGLFYQGLREGTIPCLRLGNRRFVIPIGRFLAWLGETDVAGDL